MVIKVAINGYGTIGKRVADAVARQNDMKIVGVTKTRPSFEAAAAREKGFPLFVAGDGKVDEFESHGLKVNGTLKDLLGACDVVVDCAPEKLGLANKALYDEARVAAIWQGGEKASIAERSFNALANYKACLGTRRLRVVSCNTTGLARAAGVLTSRFGVKHWEATLVRRASDPGEAKKGPINGIIPTMTLPSHHGPDVKTILPDLPIATTAVIASTTLMHVHVNHVRLARPPGSVEMVREAFGSTPRFLLFHAWQHVDGTPQIVEWARDQGRPRNDIMENVLWDEGMKLDGEDLYFFQAIHQESIVIPENIDAIRAMFQLENDGMTSIEKTDKTLGLLRPGT